MAVGLTAPWLVLALIRSPDHAVSRTCAAWHVFGLVDLVVAVSLGALVSALSMGAAGEITTSPMSRLPLLLIPAFLLPLSIMLHAAALMQVRRQRKSATH